MKTLKQVQVTVEYVTLMPDYETSKENVIYVSILYSCAIHKCLCGCGAKTVTPLTKGEWTLTENDKGVTMTPSIYNRGMDCKSHYIITNGIANFV
jgi:hypothetical protein